ncbi:hypothetical protein HUS85_33290 [Pseudomonas protegens]|uniref:hypothetical protein n=2 Tax=Pseudomonas protegens TaxID=380021 RepID=UPI001B30130A|nr:hypothetical protein [Pseudomonas protegens]MBP5120690.1 hypothetical protein [Pseudomonas protegens]QTU22418.1 hypothetical protein HUT22_31160 [Pseudomonas protegens]
MVTKQEIQSFIRTQIDKDFFDELDVLLPQTFQKALKQTQDLLSHTPPEDLRGHLRHSLLQDALASMKRWNPLVLSTNPKGHYYVLLKIGNLRITSVVLPWQKEIRKAKYRRALKALNESLASTQFDWIDGLQQTVDEQLIHALVIVHAPQPNATNQSEPRAITIAVPYFSGKGFHMNCTLEELVRGYSDNQTLDQKPVELVKLRDKMRRAEEAENQPANESISKR